MMRETTDTQTLARTPPSLIGSLAEHPLGRIIIAAVTIFCALAVYGYLNRTMPHRVDFYTSLDAAIPFMPWTIVVYMSMYLLFALASLTVNGRDFLKGMSALLVVCLISFLGFVLFTSHYPRPSPTVIEQPWLRTAFVWMFGFDQPGNTFPSLHVGTTATAALMLWNKPGRWIWAVWAVLICLSTVTVKQHYVADVAGGLLVAGFAYWWVARGVSEDGA